MATRWLTVAPPSGSARLREILRPDDEVPGAVIDRPDASVSAVARPHPFDLRHLDNPVRRVVGHPGAEAERVAERDLFHPSSTAAIHSGQTRRRRRCCRPDGEEHLRRWEVRLGTSPRPTGPAGDEPAVPG